MKISYIEVKSILNKSKLNSIDYTINPYIGCEFACKYCYASYLSNLVKEDNDKWGQFVYVKKNAIELIKKELGKMILNYQTPNIMLSSATDPYQYVEAKEKITQKILKTFIEFNFKGQLMCLTKSPMILRDIDLLKEVKNLTVSFSICHNNEKIKNFFEPNTPSINSRFNALKIFNKRGFKTCIFIAPILPYYENHINELEELFKKIKDSGTNNVVCDLLNLYGNMTRYKNCLKTSIKAQKLYFDRATDKEYFKKMENIINELIQKYQFNKIYKEDDEYFKNKRKQNSYPNTTTYTS